MRACATIWRSARGGGSWVSSLHGFSADSPLLGLPVYVHLLRQYRQKPVPFSSLMFFERRTQSSIKHRRLKYLLLFALRCAVRRSAGAGVRAPLHSFDAIARANGGRTMVFAVDNSFSMRQGDRFASAKKAALDRDQRDARGRSRPGDHFGGPAKLLTEMTQDKQALRAAVTALEPGDDASSYAELSRVLRSTAESLKTRHRRARLHRSAEVFPARRAFPICAWTTARSSTFIRSPTTPFPTGPSKTSMRRAASSTRRRSAPSPPSRATTRPKPPAKSRCSPTARRSKPKT